MALLDAERRLPAAHLRRGAELVLSPRGARPHGSFLGPWSSQAGGTRAPRVGYRELLLGNA